MMRKFRGFSSLDRRREEAMKLWIHRLKIAFFKNRIRLRTGILRTKKSLSPHRRRGLKVKRATKVLLKALMK